MRVLLPAVSVWSQFDYSSQPTHCCWQPCMRANWAQGGEKAPAGDHFGFPPWYLSPRLLPSFTTEDTRKCIMIPLASQQGVLLLAARAHAKRHRYKSILKEACTLYTPAGSGMPQWQTLRLFLAIDLLSLLFKVWFHTGKYEMSPGEGSRLGQAGIPYSRASYLCVTLGILPITAFSPFAAWSALPWISTFFTRMGAFQPGIVPGWSPSSLHAVYSSRWKEKTLKRCIEGLWAQGAQCKRWWWRRRCDADLLLTHKAVKTQTLTISKKPREDASVTYELDWTDKSRGWTDRMIAFHAITVS